MAYAWRLLFKKYDDPNLAIAMEAMIQFGLTEGRKQAAQLGFVELPQNVKEKVAVGQITPDFQIKLSLKEKRLDFGRKSLKLDLSR